MSSLDACFATFGVSPRQVQRILRRDFLLLPRPCDLGLDDVAHNKTDEGANDNRLLGGHAPSLKHCPNDYRAEESPHRVEGEMHTLTLHPRHPGA